MKKTLFFMASLCILARPSSAQTPAMTGLRDHCHMNESTREFFDLQVDKERKLKFTTATNYLVEKVADSLFAKPQYFIPETEIASAIWPFISKQLKGNTGVLSLKMQNWFLAKTSDGLAVVVSWNTKFKRWSVWCSDSDRLKTIRDIKFFYL